MNQLWCSFCSGIWLILSAINRSVLKFYCEFYGNSVAALRGGHVLWRTEILATETDGRWHQTTTRTKLVAPSQMVKKKKKKKSSQKRVSVKSEWEETSKLSKSSSNSWNSMRTNVRGPEEGTWVPELGSGSLKLRSAIRYL